MTGGEILIDGQDIRHVTLSSLRNAVGVVQQDVYLFSGTVAETSLTASRCHAGGDHCRRRWPVLRLCAGAEDGVIPR